MKICKEFIKTLLFLHSTLCLVLVSLLPRSSASLVTSPKQRRAGRRGKGQRCRHKAAQRDGCCRNVH